jgi:hypothetical protein
MAVSANPDVTTRAWGALIALSLGSALATLAGLPPKAAGLVILLLGLIKARVILARYLGLAGAPGWLTGFFAVICLWGLLTAGLYLV